MSSLIAWTVVILACVWLFINGRVVKLQNAVLVEIKQSPEQPDYSKIGELMGRVRRLEAWLMVVSLTTIVVACLYFFFK